MKKQLIEDNIQLAINPGSSEYTEAGDLMKKHPRVLNWGGVQITDDPKQHGEKAQFVARWRNYGSRSYPDYAWNCMYYTKVSLHVDSTGTRFRIRIKNLKGSKTIDLPKGFSASATSDRILITKDAFTCSVSSLNACGDLKHILLIKYRKHKADQLAQEKEKVTLVRFLATKKANSSPLYVSTLGDALLRASGSIDEDVLRNITGLLGTWGWAQNAAGLNASSLLHLRFVADMVRVNLGIKPSREAELIAQIEKAKKECERLKEESATIKASRLSPLPQKEVECSLELV